MKIIEMIVAIVFLRIMSFYFSSEKKDSVSSTEELAVEEVT